MILIIIILIAIASKVLQSGQHEHRWQNIKENKCYCQGLSAGINKTNPFYVKIESTINMIQLLLFFFCICILHWYFTHSPFMLRHFVAFPHFSKQKSTDSFLSPLFFVSSRLSKKVKVSLCH